MGPSTRCTMRAPSRAKRRNRSTSNVNELKREAGVPPESRFVAAVSPSRTSSPTRASRNWLPPPQGGVLNSLKTARSARRLRERSQSASVRPRRTSERSGRPAATSGRRVRDLLGIGESLVKPLASILNPADTWSNVRKQRYHPARPDGGLESLD